jgi:hypothetical protein
MADNEPEGQDGNYDREDQEPLQQGNVVRALKDFQREYRTAESDRTQHDNKTFIWTRRAGIGVLIYTGLTVLITVASIASAVITRQTLYASQRPWVTPESLTLKEPIRFDNGYYELNLSIILKNWGTSVARHVFAWAEFSASDHGHWDVICKTMEKQWEVAVKHNPWDFGVVLAPQQTFPNPFGLGGGILNNAPIDSTPPMQSIRNGAFWIFGCLKYQDQFDEWHFTRFAFNPNADSLHPWDLKTFVVSGAFQDAN